MRNAVGKKVVMLAIVVVAGGLFAAWSAPSIGQEAKAARKTKGRLPAYYAAVVSEEQREKIYSIQAKYQGEIAALNEQLRALVQQQNDEIEAVLTPEQLEQLKKAQADGAAKRKAAAGRKAGEAKTGPGKTGAGN